METTPFPGLGSTRPPTSSGSMPAHIVTESSLVTQLHSLFYSRKAKEEASDGDLVAQWDMIWLASALESTICDFFASPLFL